MGLMTKYSADAFGVYTLHLPEIAHPRFSAQPVTFQPQFATLPALEFFARDRGLQIEEVKTIH